MGSDMLGVTSISHLITTKSNCVEEHSCHFALLFITVQKAGFKHPIDMLIGWYNYKLGLSDVDALMDLSLLRLKLNFGNGIMEVNKVD